MAKRKLKMFFMLQEIKVLSKELNTLAEENLFGMLEKNTCLKQGRQYKKNLKSFTTSLEPTCQVLLQQIKQEEK